MHPNPYNSPINAGIPPGPGHFLLPSNVGHMPPSHLPHAPHAPLSHLPPHMPPPFPMQFQSHPPPPPHMPAMPFPPPVPSAPSSALLFGGAAPQAAPVQPQAAPAHHHSMQHFNSLHNNQQSHTPFHTMSAQQYFAPPVAMSSQSAVSSTLSRSLESPPSPSNHEESEPEPGVIIPSRHHTLNHNELLDSYVDLVHPPTCRELASVARDMPGELNSRDLVVAYRQLLAFAIKPPKGGAAIRILKLNDKHGEQEKILLSGHNACEGKLLELKFVVDCVSSSVERECEGGREGAALPLTHMLSITQNTVYAWAIQTNDKLTGVLVKQWSTQHLGNNVMIQRTHIHRNHLFIVTNQPSNNVLIIRIDSLTNSTSSTIDVIPLPLTATSLCFHEDICLSLFDSSLCVHSLPSLLSHNTAAHSHHQQTHNTHIALFNLQHSLDTCILLGANHQQYLVLVASKQLDLIELYCVERLSNDSAEGESWNVQQVSQLNVHVDDSHVQLHQLRVDPTSSFLILGFFNSHPTGVARDNGLYFIHIRSSRDGVRDLKSARFDYFSILFQAAPICSFFPTTNGEFTLSPCSIPTSCSQFDLHIVTTKPISTLNVQAEHIYRAVSNSELTETGNVTPSLPSSLLISRENSLPHSRSSPISHRPSPTSSSQPLYIEQDTTSSVEGGQRVEREEADHGEEEDDAVPALRSSLPRLLLSAHSKSESPSSPNNSNQSSALNSPALNPPMGSYDHLHDTGSGSNSPPFSPLPAASSLSSLDSRLNAHVRISELSSTPSRIRPRSSSGTTVTPASTPANNHQPSASVMKIIQHRVLHSTSNNSSATHSPLASPSSQSFSNSPSSRFADHIVSTASTATHSPDSSSPAGSSPPTPNCANTNFSNPFVSLPSTPTLSGGECSTQPTPQSTPLSGPDLAQFAPYHIPNNLSTLESTVDEMSTMSTTPSLSAQPSAANPATPANSLQATPSSSTPGTPRLTSLLPPPIVPFVGLARKSSLGSSSSPSPRLTSASPSALSPSVHSGLSFSKLGVRHQRSNSENDDASLDETNPPHNLLARKPSLPSSSNPVDHKRVQENSLITKLDQLFGRHFRQLSLRQSSDATDSNASLESNSSRNDMITTILQAVENSCQSTLIPQFERILASRLDAIASPSSPLSKHLSSEFSQAITSSFKTSFTSLLPAFQTSVQQMMSQIQASHANTLTQLSDSVKRLQLEEQATFTHYVKQMQAEETRRLNELEMKHQQELKSLQSQIAELQSQSSTQTTLLQEILLSLKSSFKPASNEGNLRSNTVDRAHLNELIAQNKVEEAFVHVLSLNQLSSVHYLCSLFDARTFFSSHPLSAAVLLSLVQQLSTNVQLDTRLSMAWLREALLAFQTNAINTHANIHVKVFSDAIQHISHQLQASILNTPSHELYDTVRMVLQLLQIKQHA